MSKLDSVQIRPDPHHCFYYRYDFCSAQFLETLPSIKIVHGEVEAGDAEPLLQQEQDLVLHPLTELTQAQDSILHSFRSRYESCPGSTIDQILTSAKYDASRKDPNLAF
jgi:hypothetical protein